MRPIIVCAAALLAAGSALPCRADEVSKKAKVEEFFNLTKLDQTIRQSMDLVMGQMKAGFMQEMLGVKLPPEAEKTVAVAQEKVGRIVTDAMDWSKVKPLYLKLFVEAYSEEELDDMLVFYRSKTGQSMVAKQPELMSKAATAMQAHLATVLPEIQRVMKETIADAMKSVDKK
jgi:hypothetical protein